MGSERKIKIGVDFDGVLAYNPLRIFRAPVVLFKKKILKKSKIKFYIPKTIPEKLFFRLAHDFSIFPSIGAYSLNTLVNEGKIEAHLVSGRYAYLNPGLYKWLEEHNLRDSFMSINPNVKDEQPHLFKERTLDELQLDYFIEDNLDIVNYLSTRSKTRILWIYNILDRKKPYPDKYPYLKKALEEIVRQDAG